jgi:hypothetical protein
MHWVTVTSHPHWPKLCSSRSTYANSQTNRRISRETSTPWWHVENIAIVSNKLARPTVAPLLFPIALLTRLSCSLAAHTNVAR